MKIEKLAAVGEIISSVAIVLTLIYLAVQTQQMSLQSEQMAIQSEQMTNAILATSRQETMAAEMNLITTLISNPQAWANLDRPIAELNEAEEKQVRNIFAGLLRIREYAWQQYKNGILDEATLNNYFAPLPRWITEMENGEYMWELLGGDLDAEFVDYVNAMIEQGSEASQ